jgi:hypothetical protein
LDWAAAKKLEEVATPLLQALEQKRYRETSKELTCFLFKLRAKREKKSGEGEAGCV